MINTLKHLCYILNTKKSELQFIISNLDSYYYEKIENKKDEIGNFKFDKTGKPKVRVLNPSINKLKQIQKNINKKIFSKLKIPDYAFGAVRGKDNVLNAKIHQGKKFKFKTDLKDFFPSIGNNQVFNMFRSFNFSPTVSRTLTQLTTYKGKLPQGAPTSPIISNLIFIKTGNKLDEFSKQNNIIFTSFIDDLTFSSPIDFKNKTKLIINIIENEGFKINHKKTFYKTKSPLITGVISVQNKIELPNSFYSRMKKTENKSIEQEKGYQIYIERVKKINDTKLSSLKYR